ncbi:protein-ADP-ribose hydrolase [Gemella sp.]
MEKLDFLIKTLNSEVEIPETEQEKKDLFRTLMSTWKVSELLGEFYEVQDEYLQEVLKAKGITRLEDLTEIDENIYIWQGDITTLEVDAIVNAANKALLGCFIPHHRCIDNAIHTQAGLQLRRECDEIMKEQGTFEKTGQAKITAGYNLPAKHVIHTVGPIIYRVVEDDDKELLASCYRNCLKVSLENNLKSIAFCCISTGEFRFPNDLAAKIAVAEVKKFFRENPTADLKVVFNVFKDLDKKLYEELLG